MQYPHTVQLETTGACNASCAFCPHSRMEGQQQARMSDALFYRLVDQMAAWETPPAVLCPFLTAEPFADPRLPKFLRYVNEQLPYTKITLFTNGSLFTPRLLADLESVRNVQSVFLSLHHSDPLTYLAEVGLDWERTVESIRRFQYWNSWVPWCPDVKLLRVQDGDPAKDAAFVEFCERTFPGIPVQLSYRYNWGGEIASPYPYADSLDEVCGRHSALCVLADGRVSLCCLDASGAYSLGDTNTTPLIDIYNGTKALEYRSKTKRYSTPCNTCNMRG